MNTFLALKFPLFIGLFFGILSCQKKAPVKKVESKKERLFRLIKECKEENRTSCFEYGQTLLAKKDESQAEGYFLRACNEGRPGANFRGCGEAGKILLKRNTNEGLRFLGKACPHVNEYCEVKAPVMEGPSMEELEQMQAPK